MKVQAENLTRMCEEILKKGGCLEDLPKERIPKLADVLNECFGQIDKPIITIAELSGINNSSIHKALNGEMNPTRNTLLRLAFTMQLSFETTQVLLKSGNRSSLSGGRDRDRIIMQGIIKGYHLGDVCDELTQNGFRDLYSKQDF